MPDWLWFILLPGFAILVVYALIRKGQLERNLKTELVERYGAGTILALDNKVKYYGVKSRGKLQPSELGAAMVVTREWIHVQTWNYGTSVGFELVLPVEQLHRYYRSKKFVTLGLGGSIGGEGLLVLRYPEPQTGEPEELALLLSQDQDVMKALYHATGRTAEEG